MKQIDSFLNSIEVNESPEYTGISGTTLINHKLRVMLGLTCEEYCVMQMMDQFSSAKDISTNPTDKRCWDNLGMKKDHVLTMIQRLISKNMLMETRDGKFSIAPRWRKHVTKSSEVFEQLYELFRKKGNRAEANRFYLALLNEMEPAQILEKAKVYMRHVHQNKIEWKYQMKLDTFLDPKTSKYNDFYPTTEPEKDSRAKIS